MTFLEVLRFVIFNYVCECVHLTAGALRDQRASDLEPELKLVVSLLLWVLRIELLVFTSSLKH